MARKSKTKWEFGDFQTPATLAKEAVTVLADLGVSPNTIIEPTCGKGSFLLAAALTFTSAERLLGVDLNGQYLSELRSSASRLGVKAKTTLITGDFFSLNWEEIMESLPEPILIVGNPPWVTSSELSALKSDNLPQKSNFQKHRGFDAKTGKSNFDISEWMLLKNLEWLDRRRGVLAVLCKTAVARKVLFHAWKRQARISQARILRINAQKHFDASVDACFLVLEIGDRHASQDCLIYKTLSDKEPSSAIGFHDNMIIADIELYQRWRHLKGTAETYVWRSGIKHDCSKVMEIERCGDKYRNGFGDLIGLEDDYLYPMLKSSDVGNGANRRTQKYMLVTQRYIGEKTSQIKSLAPKTWAYLENHIEAFQRRGSSIYRNRPRFSIFGVGAYSFSPWKIAISGFYSELKFQVIGPRENKTVVFDDTVYFLPCWSEAEARFVGNLLNSKPASEFYGSMIFLTDKRPITIEILKRLSLGALSEELGCETEYQRFAKQRRVNERKVTQNQLALWA
jgi:methylase of polypeptide subunit release factors